MRILNQNWPKSLFWLPHLFHTQMALLTLTIMLVMTHLAKAEPSAQVSIQSNPQQDAGVSMNDPFEGAKIVKAENISSKPFSDPRDLFGGTFTELEPGHLLGSDEAPMLGWSVQFTTAHKVTIDGFELFLADDANGARSASGFKFYQDDKLLASGTIATPYPTNYGSNDIKVSVKFATPVTGDKWKLEVQAGTGSGVRALELDAIPSSKGK